ncbi:MAG: L-2-amino-thiazoline-4-carboxylic acid hydrolase [Methanobacterium sp.]
MEELKNNYYNKKRSQFFRQFNEFNGVINKLISQKYGKDFADMARDEIKDEYESIYDEIPYIGGDLNPLTSDMVSAVMDLAVYLVLKRHGMKLADIGEIAYKASEELLALYPEAADLATNPKYIPYIKMGADRSAERQYQEDWVYSFCEGNGDFDYGLDFTECGIQKFFHKYDADEFTPYLCAMDIIMSDIANAGLHRTETLAEGGNKCNFRYKKGRETKVSNTVIGE